MLGKRGCGVLPHRRVEQDLALAGEAWIAADALGRFDVADDQMRPREFVEQIIEASSRHGANLAGPCSCAPPEEQRPRPTGLSRFDRRSDHVTGWPPDFRAG